MSIKYFTEEQLEELRKNPYVKKAGNKAITYEEGFKELFIKEYEKGKSPSLIFREAGFDTRALGKDRIHTFARRTKSQVKRAEGFEDQRKYSSGRSVIRELTAEEKIERLESRNRLLKQENDFLKRVRYLNRKSLSKKEQTSPSRKNTNS